MEADKPRRQAELMRCLGLDPLPERGPLRAMVTGVLKGNGYWIEKVVFESRLNFPVTGHLYIPDGPAGVKHPVILNPHGHWSYKKFEPTVQARVISQVLNGYMAFVIDSPGYSFDKDFPVERKKLGSHMDFPRVLGCADATSIYVWDLMRALDYLETRHEADMTRVGITGASGGGIPSIYAFAADERIKCSVPVVYATSLEINPDNGCPCNHIAGTLQIGDRSDVLAIRAPSPVMVFGAQVDNEFPPEGTQLTGEKLRAIYKLYGHENNAQWRIFEGGHDYSKAMREQAISFFNLHLKGEGDGSPVPDPVFETRDPEDPSLRCDPSPNASRTTMRDIAWNNLLRTTHHSFEEVAKLNGGIPERAPLNVRSLGVVDGAEVVLFDSEPGLTIPALLWTPAKPNGKGVVIVSEEGKVATEQEFSIQYLVEAGFTCIAPDVRGVGELRGETGPRKGFGNIRCLDLRLMVYLGTADAFAMASDALASADVLRESCSSVAMVGRGLFGSQVSVFAGLMDPALAFVVGLNGMGTYAECFDIEEDQFWIENHTLQPRAMYGTTLSNLQDMLGERGAFTLQGESNPKLVELLSARF
jgi:cephalosporin-C deacetylase-like acetyl esterase